MRFVLTHCPRCHAYFYVESESTTKVDATCPYCRFKFSDRVKQNQVKEVDYYWELYNDIYPPLKNRYGGSKILKASGVLLMLTIPLFLLSIANLVPLSHLSGMNLEEQSIRAGIGLSILVFIGFVTGGGWSSLKKYSFPVSLAGSIFGLLNSFLLWSLIYLDYFLRWNGAFNYSVYIAFFLSMTSLLIVIHHRWNFEVGY